MRPYIQISMCIFAGNALLHERSEQNVSAYLYFCFSLENHLIYGVDIYLWMAVHCLEVCRTMNLPHCLLPMLMTPDNRIDSPIYYICSVMLA